MEPQHAATNLANLVPTLINPDTPPTKTRLEVVVSETRTGYGGAQLTWENLAAGQPETKLETNPFQGPFSYCWGFCGLGVLGVYVKRLR